MRISYQNETLFPGAPASFHASRQLYRHYEQSVHDTTSTRSVHWFDFQTNRAHELDVRYVESIYKMVLCIKGNSRSLPTGTAAYGFHTGQALFYRTEKGDYQAALPAATDFKVIHIHLSDAHVKMLQENMPILFERAVPPMPLSADCAAAFLQLKTLPEERPGLLALFEEKLITDQLFTLAKGILPRTDRRSEALLQEAIWHIRRSERYLTITELAKLVGINTFRLKQLFREQLHTSVFQYQADLRLENGARLLLDTSLDVTDIAGHCGYESTAAFSNAFLRQYGVRPSAYKNSRTHK